MHTIIDPAILYFGTPVVLISTLNEDGTPNLAPMSSAWWLGKSCMLGLGARSHTPANILRTRECVLNLPSVHESRGGQSPGEDDGSDPVPPHKQAMGYRHERDKFGIAGLTPVISDCVAPPRVAECPVHLEAVLEGTHALAASDPDRRGRLIGIEVRIVRVHVDERIRMAGYTDRIDPKRWRPLIMSFQQFFGLTDDSVHHSTLGEIPESAYRPPQTPQRLSA